MGRRRLSAALLAATLPLAVTAADPLAVTAAEDGDRIRVAAFSELASGDLAKNGSLLPELPQGWQPLTFPGVDAHTRYRLVSIGGDVALRADADASASGLVREVEIDPQAFPVIEWRWRIGGLIPGADVHAKSGDDYPARIYIVFRSPDGLGWWQRLRLSVYRLITGQEPPTAAISYIWDGRAEAGSIVPNAYTDAIQMFVVQSGPEVVGEWVSERRNVADDFRAAFGTEPPPIVGVAVMTDADNTGTSATAWYGDITFLSRDAAASRAWPAAEVR
jgi:hypothetical protein